MSDPRYGRLFTEADAQQLMHWAFRLARRTELHSGPPEDMVGAFEDAGGRIGDGDGRARELAFPADEPLFLLRGSLRASLFAIEHYALNSKVLGASPEVVEEADAAAREVRAWQSANQERVSNG